MKRAVGVIRIYRKVTLVKLIFSCLYHYFYSHDGMCVLALVRFSRFPFPYFIQEADTTDWYFRAILWLELGIIVFPSWSTLSSITFLVF